MVIAKSKTLFVIGKYDNGAIDQLGTPNSVVSTKVTVNKAGEEKVTTANQQESTVQMSVCVTAAILINQGI